MNHAAAEMFFDPEVNCLLLCATTSQIPEGSNTEHRDMNHGAGEIHPPDIQQVFAVIKV
jgi:hypothetical protein